MQRTSLTVLIFVVTLGTGPIIGAQESRTMLCLPGTMGAVKQAIVAFVARVTQQGSPDLVSPAERIATFDNDGTLWCERPMYVQMAFVLDRVKELVPKNSEWKNKQPFKAVLEKDLKALAAQGEKGDVQLVAATHTGMSSDEFNRIGETKRHLRLEAPLADHLLTHPEYDRATSAEPALLVDLGLSRQHPVSCLAGDGEGGDGDAINRTVATQ